MSNEIVRCLSVAQRITYPPSFSPSSGLRSCSSFCTASSCPVSDGMLLPQVPDHRHHLHLDPAAMAVGSQGVWTILGHNLLPHHIPKIPPNQQTKGGGLVSGLEQLSEAPQPTSSETEPRLNPRLHPMIGKGNKLPGRLSSVQGPVPLLSLGLMIAGKAHLISEL